MHNILKKYGNSKVELSPNGIYDPDSAEAKPWKSQKLKELFRWFFLKTFALFFLFSEINRLTPFL